MQSKNAAERVPLSQEDGEQIRVGDARQEHPSMVKGLLLDGLAGFAALVIVVTTILFAHVQQDLRPLVLATAAAYFAVGFWRGLKVPTALIPKAAVVALGGIVPVAAICVGGLNPKLQILFVSFAVASLLWAIAGVRTRQLIEAGKSRQSAATSLVAVLALFASVYFVLPAWMDARAASWISQPQPVIPFTITTLDGQTLRSGNLKGRVVVFAFWATWCAPCEVELPQIAKLEARYRAHADVLIVALNSKTNGDTADKARAFLGQRRLDLTAAIDDADDAHPDGRGLAGRSLGLNSLPSLYILDRGGRLRVVYNGYDSSENLVCSLSHVIDRLELE